MYNFCDINIHVGDSESIGLAIVIFAIIIILFCVCIPLAIKAKSEEKNKEFKSQNSITKPVNENRMPLENEWKCSKCGSINKNYVGTCGCGAEKNEAKSN